MIKLMSIAGARPNFMKLASIVNAIELNNKTNSILIEHTIVHTGQHYDQKMSNSFFEDLGLPAPNVNLEVGSGSHASQTAEIMKRFEPILLEMSPDFLLVVGDVNSTIACSLVASKINYSRSSQRQRPLIVHVEAGLRSFDRNMPEEINRILTDSLSDLLFITEESAAKNLHNEGIDKDKIHFVGNVMIDTLQQHIKKAEASPMKQTINAPQKYGLITLHRPSNVDQKSTLKPLIDCLQSISKQCHLIFPVHPRTKKCLINFDLWEGLKKNDNISLTEPLGYIDFLSLVKSAALVITDSGGLQEETTVLGIPCVTLRENTERPVTITIGTNYLVGTNIDKILETVNLILNGSGKKGNIPKYWDGNAGKRIITAITSAA